MARTSITQFRNGNSNIITVSGLIGGHTHARYKYMADGILSVGCSGFTVSTTSAIEITNFPYKFKIIDCFFNQISTTATLAGADVNLYRGTLAASAGTTSLFICGVSAAASRDFSSPVLMNFNVNEIDVTDKILVIASGLGDASCATLKGDLTLIIRPV